MLAQERQRLPARVPGPRQASCSSGEPSILTDQHIGDRACSLLRCDAHAVRDDGEEQVQGRQHVEKSLSPARRQKRLALANDVDDAPPRNSASSIIRRRPREAVGQRRSSCGKAAVTGQVAVRIQRQLGPGFEAATRPLATREVAGDGAQLWRSPADADVESSRCCPAGVLST